MDYVECEESFDAIAASGPNVAIGCRIVPPRLLDRSEGPALGVSIARRAPPVHERIAVTVPVGVAPLDPRLEVRYRRSEASRPVFSRVLRYAQESASGHPTT